MKLSLKWLKEKEACVDGMLWYKSKSKTLVNTVEKCIDALIKDKKYDYAHWLLTNVFTKEQNVRYSIYSAYQVIANFEKRYNDDKRPRQAIEAAEAWLNNPCEETESAAESAVRSAARSAAWSAWSAWSAAWSAAARSAARSAVWSAESARSAAESVAESAARSKMNITIINYGLSLLK